MRAAGPGIGIGIAVASVLGALAAFVRGRAAIGEIGSPAAASAADARCPENMAAVEGFYCPAAYQRCAERTDDPSECVRFREPSICRGPRQRMRYCIDRYEWPNHAGERPAVMLTFTEATALCAGVGRRLCTQDEWIFACEGEAMLPYPFGYDRSIGGCWVDREVRRPNGKLLHSPQRDVAFAEAMRVYGASPSGTAPLCVSPFGVHDLMGNVDEWTENPSGQPRRSFLMGGFWGPNNGRCRGATVSHDENFRYYQIGFRCCGDPRSTSPP